MGTTPTMTLQLLRGGFCVRSGATGAAALPQRHAFLAFDAAPVRCFSSKLIGNDTVTKGKRGLMKPIVSSVKRMPPPPPPPLPLPLEPQQGQPCTSSAPSLSSSSSLPSLSLKSASHPLLDVEEIIIALADIFRAYKGHLHGEASAIATGTTEEVGSHGGNGDNFVPFYPPIPLCHLERCFQPLLQRLLPAGTTMPVVHLTGDDETAEKNRKHLASRIESCGIFKLTARPRAPLHRIDSTDITSKGFFLRIKPGVRELAADIIAFLLLLEPTSVTLRKAVPLAVIRRMSLTPAAATFIRNELGNDIKRLILVYHNDVFTLTRNGTMVRLQGAFCGKKEWTTPPPSLVSVPSSAQPGPALPQSGCRAFPSVDAVKTSTTPPDLGSLSPNRSTVPLLAAEVNTFMHMGKRFVAPAAIERYRFSQRLVPLLEFIPVARSRSPRTVGDGCSCFQLCASPTDDDYDGFVDFVAVRDRAVTKYPQLSPLLKLNCIEVRERHEGLLFSAFTALGVEWRWGRALLSPSFLDDQHRRRRPQHLNYHHHHTADQHDPLSATGLLFIRRQRCLSPTAAVAAEQTSLRSSSTEIEPFRVLLIDLQVECEEIASFPYNSEWCKWQGYSHMADETSESRALDKDVDIGDRALSALHAFLYEELVSSAAMMRGAMMSVASTLSPDCILDGSAMYPAGACADRAFVLHLLRYFTTRHHEDLQNTLEKEVQGCVAPLFQHEIRDSISCLFFTYGRISAGSDASCSEKLDGNSNSRWGGTDRNPLVFNNYVDGFYVQNETSRLPCIRSRFMPGEPLLLCSKILPARLVLEVLRCLYHQQLRCAEEIGLALDDGDVAGDSSCCISYGVLRDSLSPASRVYIRDNVGEHMLISLLVSHLPRHFCVPMMDTAPSWSALGLTREGRCLAHLLEEEGMTMRAAVSFDNSDVDGKHSSACRSRRTGCIFTNDARQQLDTFMMCL